MPSLAEHEGEGILIRTPFHDKLLFELAMAAIEGEALGSDETTDILAISLSALDSIGYRYGPASVEVQDMILRLDKYIGQFLDYLNESFGKENILLLLTSDHGVVDIPQYLIDQGIPGGYLDLSPIREALGNILKRFMERISLLHLALSRLD